MWLRFYFEIQVKARRLAISIQLNCICSDWIDLKLIVFVQCALWPRSHVCPVCTMHKWNTKKKKQVHWTLFNSIITINRYSFHTYWRSELRQLLTNAAAWTFVLSHHNFILRPFVGFTFVFHTTSLLSLSSQIIRTRPLQWQRRGEHGDSK